MLVVTPAPYNTESLIGYVIRLAERNGYDSPGTILSYAGYGSASAVGATCDLRPLSKVLGRKADAFSKIAYGDVLGEKSHRVTFRGHEVSVWRAARILSPKRTSICPLCIAEQGFLDSFWDLTLATACPKHGCKALHVCPSCTRKVTWLRPGLLECQCGAFLGDVWTGNEDPPALELLGLLQAKLEKRSLQTCQNSSRLPAAELDRMTFNQLASVLFVLGQHIKRLSHREALQKPHTVVLGAAEALSDWPSGFRRSLRELGMSNMEMDCQLDRLREQYGALYRAITGERSLAPATVFLRREFDAFLENETSRDVLRERQLNQEQNAPLRKTMTVDWICSRYDFSRKRLEGWCKARRKNKATISPADLKRFAVDAEIINRLKIAKTRGITERQAAAMAGLPVTVLKGLRELGQIGSQNVDNLRRGYRASDIEKLTKTLQEIGSRVSQESIEAELHVSLARLLETATFWSKLGKAEFLIDVLEGTIEPYGRTGDSLQQLFFDKEMVDERIAAKKTANWGRGVARTKAGKMLGCSTDCVNELVNRGHLVETTGPYYQNICAESIRKFGAEFAALNDLAKRVKSSARAIRRKAQKDGLELLLIKSRHGVTTPFIRKSQLEKLEQTVDQQRSDAALGSERQRNRAASIDRLSRYLDAMRFEARPLPRTGRRLNVRGIAEACGIDRSLIYRSQEVRDMFAAAGRDDAAKHGVDSRPDLAILSSFLDELRVGNGEIPIGRRGEPNKLEIARSAGVDRNIFYTSKEANKLLSCFQGEAPAIRQLTRSNKSAPAATLNSPICGRVKIPQLTATGRGVFTRSERALQLAPRPL